MSDDNLTVTETARPALASERPTSVPLGPVTLFREPFFRLAHGVRIPIHQDIVHLLGTYRMDDGDARELARDDLPEHWSDIHSFGGDDGRRYRGPVECLAYAHAVRVTYPAPFVVILTQVHIGAPQPEGWADWISFPWADELTTIETAAEQFLMAGSRKYYDEGFADLVESQALSLYSSAVGCAGLQLVEDKTGFGVRLGQKVAYFDSSERKAWLLFGQMIEHYPDGKLSAETVLKAIHCRQREEPADPTERARAWARRAQNLCNIANARLQLLCIEHKLASSLVTGLVSWEPLDK